MGISILELVLRTLRNADFIADVAFPGQKYPIITQPVAAVHINKVDRSNMTVTVEVHIMCPASLGGTCCEMEALRATEALRRIDASCVQNGCEYDGLTRVYVVRIMATFTCATEAENCTMGPGFRVYIQENLMPFAVSFHSRQTIDVKAVHEIGENAPIGIHEGSTVWEFQLEELIPAGSLEHSSPEGVFKLALYSDTVEETYNNCRWTSVRREFTRQGLRRIRNGISLERVGV